MAHVQDVDSAHFDAEVLDSATPVLVDFWAPWCQPCLMVAPVIERLAEDFAGRIKVVRVNVADNGDLATRFSLRGIPTLIFFRDGQVVNQLLGAQPEPMIVQAIEGVLQ